MNKHIPPALIALCLLTTGLRADDPRPFSHPDRIRYDGHCLTIEGKDMFIYSGAFHYFRCPKELWPQRFQAIKDAGFNTVETYTAWNYHEREMPASVDDFSKVKGLNDLDDWLTMAEKYGLYVIIRPGPYICAEWSTGGFPRWMSVLKKPAAPLRKEGWLRSDDPVYLAWCKHWYDAVCPIIAKHQITHKSPGEPGIILFQIENEYNFWKMPSDVKVNYLTALANDAKADGIDVPLISCWTKEIHGVKSGPLRGVFDCPNFYPRLAVEKEMGGVMRKYRAEQPDAPMGTTELQGGWFAEVGGKLSAKQPGLTPAEIQNITLYAWQMGDTLTNYYMLFGGTNFDDWAGGKNITSYDYDAPIREDGGVGDRYQRVAALGAMIREHGASLARSDEAEITATISDNDVEVAERRALDGSRYIFVRTQNNNDPRNGTAKVKEKDGTELSFDYKLEPFGAMVLYLPPGVTDASKGEWLPKSGPEIARPKDMPAPVVISDAKTAADPLPAVWSNLRAGAPLEAGSVYGSHYVYYLVSAAPGSTVTVNVPAGDGIVASVNGSLQQTTADRDKSHYTFTMPSAARKAVLLYENLGHVNFGPKMTQASGILSVQGADSAEPLEWGQSGDQSEAAIGYALSTAGEENRITLQPAKIGPDAGSAPDALLTWYSSSFTLPTQATDVFMPWHLHIEAKGNGFIYVNGHCIGRYWQAGPQHDFYVPECWLNFGAINRLALNLRPVDKGVSIQALSMAPDGAFSVVASK